MRSTSRTSFAVAIGTAVLVALSSGPSTVAGDPSPKASPVVSLGEPWILYQWDTGGGLGDPPPKALFLVRPDGSDAHRIVGDPSADFFHPDWSPDGSRIAFSAWSDIQVATADGSDRRVVATCTAPCDQVDWPAWSPDGRTIAFRRLFVEDGVYTGSAIDAVDLDTFEVTTLFTTAMPQYVEFLRWAPDGQRMVVSLSHYTPGQSVTVEGPLPDFAMTLAVLAIGAGPSSTPDTIPGTPPFADAPDWSPTDDRIVFTTYDLGPFNQTDEPSNLYTVRPDGSDLTQLTFFSSGEDRATEPIWTPDGGRIVFAWASAGDGPDGDYPAQVGFVDADGGNLTHGLPAPDPVYMTHPRLRPTP